MTNSFITTGLVGAAMIGLLVMSEREHGLRIHAEAKYQSVAARWHADTGEGMDDGAVRTGTSVFKDGRELTIRCFRALPDANLAKTDLRYTIFIPLLAKVAGEIEKAGPIELMMSVDGQPVHVLPGRVIAHDFGISFLAPVSLEQIGRLKRAGKKLVARPRQAGKHLDRRIEFPVTELAEQLPAVEKACAAPVAVPSCPATSQPALPSTSTAPGPQPLRAASPDHPCSGAKGKA